MMRWVQLGSMSLPNARHLVLAFRLCHTAPPGTPLRQGAWLAEPAPTFQTLPELQRDPEPQLRAALGAPAC